MKVSRRDAEQFIQVIGAAAREAMLKTGIPASFLIADFALVTQFGEARVCSFWNTALDRFPEPLFFAANQNRWSALLGQARTIRGYYQLSGEHTPTSLTRTLAQKGYFARNPHHQKQLLALINRYALQKWDRFSASDVRRYKREWLQSKLFSKFGAITRELRKAGVSRETLGEFVQVAG